MNNIKWLQILRSDRPKTKAISTTFSKLLVVGQRVASEKNCRKFLETTITKKWYPVMRLKLYQSSKIKLPLPKEKYKYLRKLMLRHFLHSCYNIPARKEKDLTSKMGLKMTKNLRQKKRDVKYNNQINILFIQGKKY